MIVQKGLKRSLFTPKIKLRCPVTFLIWPQPAFPFHLFAPLPLSSGEPGSPPGRSVPTACSSSLLYIPSSHCLPLATSFATSRSCLNMACSLLDSIWVELITPSSPTGSFPLLIPYWPHYKLLSIVTSEEVPQKNKILSIFPVPSMGLLFCSHLVLEWVFELVDLVLVTRMGPGKKYGKKTKTKTNKTVPIS